ncbi:MAG TPA: hypothetical protein PK156_25310 [Polyangium sp.]|nr:hypothetical protein [Polyangium sp.]
MADASLLPAERRVPYSQVRDEIEDGDVILFRGEAELSHVIAGISQSAYSHAGFVLSWYHRRMLLSAEMPKVLAMPLSLKVAHYKGRIDWYKLLPEGRAQLDLERLAVEALTNLGLEYGTSKLFELASHFILGTNADDDDCCPETFVCSQYVSRCYRLAGLDLSTKSDLATVPGEIAVSPMLCYQATFEPDLKDVNEVRVRRAI